MPKAKNAKKTGIDVDGAGAGAPGSTTLAGSGGGGGSSPPPPPNAIAVDSGIADPPPCHHPCAWCDGRDWQEG